MSDNTYEDVVRWAFVSIVLHRGREVAADLLAQFAVEKASQLPIGRWGEFIEAAALVLSGVAVPYATPTLDKLENTTERVRPRLTWADSKPVDRFPGFTVSSDTTPTEATHSHPLQVLGDLNAPGHGSCALLKVR
jgi:hypothetical protein